jgi:hypothetical protein
VDLYAQIQSSAETKFSTGFNFKVNKQLLWLLACFLLISFY